MIYIIAAINIHSYTVQYKSFLHSHIVLFFFCLDATKTISSETIADD